jgi:alcohol dehydrogenase (cytochrome c)
MIRARLFLSCLATSIVTAMALGAIPPTAFGQVKNFAPVTREMLLNPPADDWLMPSRTYDMQRFSPLNQITRQNVGSLRMVWARGMALGPQENIPLLHQGVLYVGEPGDIIEALDATNGDLIWEYRHKLPDDYRSFIGDTAIIRVMAIYDDMLFFTSAEGYVVALDARTGALRWETKASDYKIGVRQTSGPIVAEGKVISGRTCPSSVRTKRVGCFIVAHDAKTGQELWKFYVTPAPGEPGGDSWGSVPVDLRMASPWGVPGGYDPVRKLVFWGIGEPRPHTRLKRHGGNLDDIPRMAPADLYSDSTVALDPDTGKLAWYFQHLPGDDWDQDFTHERILLRTSLDPDPVAVKWISPKIARGEQRDIVVTVGEPGGIWVLDRSHGQFLWATPFPYDVPEFVVSKVDVETGKTFINWDQVLKKNGDKKLVCFGNTRGYWPMAYHPGTNSLYISYHDECEEHAVVQSSEEGDSIKTVRRPGSDPNAFGGIAKVNMTSGQIQRFYQAPIGGNGAMLATAGDLIFWGDLNRRFRAFDAASGKILWETILGGVIQNSTITYAVNGKQYVAVMTGDGASHTQGPLGQVPEIKPPRGHNAIYVFALP